MTIIQTIYVIGAIVAVSACLPQINQLRRSKASDEFSLATWVIWLVTQVVSFAYVTVLGDMLLMVVNLVWVSFYVIMVGLIVHYKHVRPLILRRQAVPAENIE